jgi:hypothetical protein
MSATLGEALTEVNEAHGNPISCHARGCYGEHRYHAAHLAVEQVRAVREWLAGEEVLKAAAHAIHGNTIGNPDAGEPMIREQRDTVSVILDAAAALDAVRGMCGGEES